MGVTAKTHSQECCRYLYHLNTWDFVSMKLKALFILYKYDTRRGRKQKVDFSIFLQMVSNLIHIFPF